MTRRGRRVLWLALGLYIAAWGFGTDAMFPVAVGLALAPAAAWGWVRLLDRPMRLRRRAGHLELVEGQSFAVGLEVTADGGPLPSRAVVVDRVGKRPVSAQVVRSGRVLRGRYEVVSAFRGRYRLGGAELVIGDGFGLAEARIALDRSDEVIVYPRVYPLEGLFTDAGGSSGEQGRALLHRTAGYDLHSIRDHQQGESLRRVHWRSTAKRRKLMVKELQDTPRDEASVLLDGDAQALAGEAPESTFDYQVRAAASLLHRLVESGQRSSLVIHGAVAHARAGRRRRRELGDGAGSARRCRGRRAPVARGRAGRERARRDTSRRRPRVRRHGGDVGRVRRAAARPSLGAARRRRRVGRRRGLRRPRARHRPGRGGAPAHAIRAFRWPGSGSATTSAGRSPRRRCGWWWRVPDRRVSVTVMAVALIVYGGAHWAQMESPALGMRWVFGLAALAILPAIVSAYGHQRLAWLVALPAACVAAVGLVTGLWPWSTQHGFYPRAVAGVLNDGAHSWFTAHTPFDAGRFVAVDSDLKLAFFALAAILAWTLICRGWALAAVAVGFLLFAFPSTVVDMSAGGLRAAIFLGLALGALYVTGDRLPRSGAAPQAALLGATAVIAGLIVGGAPGVSKQAFLGWQQWNPLAKPDKLVNVQYVWDQNYKPLHWPKKRTVVMEVHSPVPLYWKAAVLTAFNNDHWTQAGESIPSANQVGGSYLIPPGYLPPNVVTADITDTVKITVKIDGLADPHLIGTGQAMRWTFPPDVRSYVGLDGTVTTTSDPPRGATYAETAYTPNPSPTDLASTGTAYPPEVTGGITVGGTQFAPFGSGKRPIGTPIPEDYLRARGSGVARVGRRQGHDAVRGRVPRRALPPLAAVHVRPDAGAQEGRPAARRLHDAEAPRLLPDVLGRDGARAADARHPGAGRGRLHDRKAAAEGGRPVHRHRPQRPCVGRGVLPRVRVDAVRADAERAA